MGRLLRLLLLVCLQDLGNYERFMNVKLSNDSNLTTGKVYQSVIEKERRGEHGTVRYLANVRSVAGADSCCAVGGQASIWVRRSRLCRISPTRSR